MRVASARHVAAAERERKAVELRRAGLTWAEVAAGAGYASKQGACTAVRRHLAAVVSDTRDNVEELRALELDRLDVLQRGIWAQARAGRVKAVDRALAIMAQRAKLLGLNTNERTAANAMSRTAAVLERDIATEVVAVVLALADRLDFTPAQRANAPAALLNELSERGLIPDGMVPETPALTAGG